MDFLQVPNALQPFAPPASLSSAAGRASCPGSSMSSLDENGCRRTRQVGGGGYRGCALKHLKQHAKQPLPQPWQFDQNGLSHLFSRRQNSPIWFEPTHRFCSLLFLLNSLVHSEDHLQIEPRVPRGFMRQSARQECSLPCHISL